MYDKVVAGQWFHRPRSRPQHGSDSSYPLPLPQTMMLRIRIALRVHELIFCNDRVESSPYVITVSQNKRGNKLLN